MNKNIVIALVLLSSLAISIVSTQPVNAQFLGSVYIAADGSIVGTNNIQRNGNIYTLAGDISGGIQVQRSNIIIDGSGYLLQGNGAGRGLDLSNGRGEDPSRPEIDNVTVKNLQIIDFYYGVNNVNTNNNTFIGNYIEDCLDSFWIIGSSNNIITSNTLKNASIEINGAGSNTITKNNFIDSLVTDWASTQPTVDGNYWSDYTTRYPNAKEIGNTGVWDTPYEYWENIVDNHPLMNPVAIPLTGSSPSPSSKPSTSTISDGFLLIIVDIIIIVVTITGFAVGLRMKKHIKNRAPARWTNSMQSHLSFGARVITFK